MRLDRSVPQVALPEGSQMMNVMSQPVAPADRREPESGRLMQIAGDMRSRLFPWSSDEGWRRERLFRYLYWREHREHPRFNLVRSRERVDLEREIARWHDLWRRRIDETEALRLLTDELQACYGRTWEEALEEGTAPLLASVHMPVWHEATGALLPATLGPLLIHHAERFDDPKRGWFYRYGRSETGQRLTVALYDDGVENLADGIGDPRLPGALRLAFETLRQVAEANGCRMRADTLHGPGEERLRDAHGREASFVSVYVEFERDDGSCSGEALSLRVFRGHFLQVRYTQERMPCGEADLHPELAAINADLADFVTHFG
jgi:hypothetical protein